MAAEDPGRDQRTAVVLLNLGAPDGAAAVEPFLFNLFNDPAIVRVPGPLRWLIARLIARRRAPVARAIYARMGGGSPLLANTMAQARALEAELADLGACRIFVAMRHWHPMSEAVARTVKEFDPHRIVLLPLYPQYSTTTSQSSALAWAKAARHAGLAVPTRLVCCYPCDQGLAGALATRTEAGLAALDPALRRRVLFSAHGLPKRIVAAGDPYPWQVEATCREVVTRLARPDLDWQLCYQSRVGPLEWIGPATDKSIEAAGREGLALVVVPIAFVSEHSETLVELDHDYAILASKSGVPAYVRVPTVSVMPDFIGGLARMVRRAIDAEPGIGSAEGGRICPARCGGCAMAAHGIILGAAA